MTPLCILLADDHVMVRQGLRKLLEERPEWRVLEAGDGRDAVQQAEAHRPDVAIIDIAMPLLSGIDATRCIRTCAPFTKVLMLSMHTDDTYVADAFRAGAAGYLLKDSADVDLLRAISAVASGRSFVSPAIERLLLTGQARAPGEPMLDRYAMLTAREREVFQLVAESRGNKEIAARLSISPSTVETHRAHIMEKMDLHSAADITRYAVRRGVIT